MVRLEPDSGFNLIDEDPRFVRSPSPGMDATWGTKDDDSGDLRLRFDSPAIDAGSTLLLPADTFDLDGDGDVAEPIPVDAEGGPRVEGSQVDIGAFEGVAVAPRAVLATTITYAVGHADVWFDGTGSYDPNDDPLTYMWQIDLDADGNYDGPGETVSTAASLGREFSDPGTYGLRLTVSDGEYCHAATASLTVLSSPILFVDDDAPAGGDGNAWSTPLNSLQTALDRARMRNAGLDPLNDVAAIWIAQGTYIPQTFAGIRSATFSLVGGVSLYGGFVGTESTLDQREQPDGVLTHETILSGDLNKNRRARPHRAQPAEPCVPRRQCLHGCHGQRPDKTDSSRQTDHHRRQCDRSLRPARRWGLRADVPTP